MKEKDAIYMKEDFTDEDASAPLSWRERVCLHERLGVAESDAENL